jgi:hypothetical protein
LKKAFKSASSWGTQIPPRDIINREEKNKFILSGDVIFIESSKNEKINER